MYVVIRGSIFLLMTLVLTGRVAAAQDDSRVADATAAERFAVGIRLNVDPSIPPGRITDRLKAETAAIWDQYGVRIEWADATTNESVANGVSLDASLERQFETPRQRQWTTVLGRVTVMPGAPRRKPIRVSFDATKTILSLRHTTRTSLAGIVLDQELARALGRVLAHEIGHVLLGAPYHDREGLMRPVFSPEELAEANRVPFRLTCGSLGRLRERLRVLASGAPF